jgi:hypothetical protein
MLSSTVDGCRFLAANGASIVRGIELCREAAKSGSKSEKWPGLGSELGCTPLTIAHLLNDLCLSMKSKGIEIGPHLCNAALLYSVSHFQFQLTKRYLQVMAENRYAFNSDGRQAVAKLPVHVARPQALQNRNQRPLRLDPKAAVLNLLTGWESNGVPLSGEERKPSISHLLSQDYNEDSSIDLYADYVVALGEMGESKVLLQESTSVQDAALPPLFRGGQSPRKRACMLAVGFVIANDLGNAEVVLKTAFAETTREVEGDVLLPVLMKFSKSRGFAVGHALKRHIEGFVSNHWESALDLIKRLVLYKELSAAPKGTVLVGWLENGAEPGHAVLTNRIRFPKYVNLVGYDTGISHQEYVPKSRVV